MLLANDYVASFAMVAILCDIRPKLSGGRVGKSYSKSILPHAECDLYNTFNNTYTEVYQREEEEEEQQQQQQQQQQ